MIPRITHSRSQLFSYMNDFEDGAYVFGLSCDTYPELFEIAHPDLVHKSPNRWKFNKKGNCKYLWFPANCLTEEEVVAINEWCDKFKQYVLLGLNAHIEDHFSTELDFCMALDFNFDPTENRRTIYGEAEFQLKYRASRPHLQVLRHAISDALNDLPIPEKLRNDLAISYVPAASDVCSVPRKLASVLADDSGYDLIHAILNCPKAGLKGVTVEEKIPIWQELYNDGCVELSGSVEGRLVVVVDDLYQSGATLWMYARHLKEQGAAHVIGLPCVKSLRDSDNQ